MHGSGESYIRPGFSDKGVLWDDEWSMKGSHFTIYLLITEAFVYKFAAAEIYFWSEYHKPRIKSQHVKPKRST